MALKVSDGLEITFPLVEKQGLHSTDIPFTSLCDGFAISYFGTNKGMTSEMLTVPQKSQHIQTASIVNENYFSPFSMPILL